MDEEEFPVRYQYQYVYQYEDVTSNGSNQLTLESEAVTMLDHPHSYETLCTFSLCVVCCICFSEQSAIISLSSINQFVLMLGDTLC